MDLLISSIYLAISVVSRCKTIKLRFNQSVSLVNYLLMRDFNNQQFHYRATRMHSADYAMARCPSVCPSVCHTPVLCLNSYTYPLKSFFTVGQTHHSSVSIPYGSVECKIEPQLLWKANRKQHESFRMVPLSMTLSDL